MVLGDAEEKEIFRPFPIGLAEFPERSADQVEAGGRHVDRAKTAMGGKIGRAELRRPPAGQGLALIAPGKEGEFRRVVAPDRAEPADRDRQRLFPLDLDELAFAPLADPLRLPQPGGRIMLHDPGRALAAQNALVDRMVAVALDVADFPVADVDLDAAPAGAHVAGGELRLVADRRRRDRCPAPAASTPRSKANRQARPSQPLFAGRLSRVCPMGGKPAGRAGRATRRRPYEPPSGGGASSRWSTIHSVRSQASRMPMKSSSAVEPATA